MLDQANTLSFFKFHKNFHELWTYQQNYIIKQLSKIEGK